MYISIDERIRNLAKKSVLELPPDYEMDVIRLLNALNEKEQSQRFIPLSRVIVMTASFVFVFTVGVYATINYAKLRMEAMDSDEKSHYVEGIQAASANADKYSRTLTGDEAIRFDKLKTEYGTDGIFPKDELLQVNFVKEVPEDMLCFVATISTFYFPEREMTDEELLQFIDFYYKRDYGVLEASSEIIAENVIANQGIIGNSAVQTAKQLLMDVYGVDMEAGDYSVELVHHNAKVVDDLYWIEISRPGKKYTVSIDAKSNLVQTLQYVDLSESISEASVNENSFLEKYQDIKELLLTQIAKTETISKAYLEYAYNSDNILLNGEIKIFFEMENETGYSIIYDFNSNSIQIITYAEDNSVFKQTLQKDLISFQMHDLTQKILELQ